MSHISHRPIKNNTQYPNSKQGNRNQNISGETEERKKCISEPPCVAIRFPFRSLSSEILASLRETILNSLSVSPTLTRILKGSCLKEFKTTGELAVVEISVSPLSIPSIARLPVGYSRTLRSRPSFAKNPFCTAMMGRAFTA